eukprot:scaffold2226_cov28-Tisochrysis_lutea.AAC.2
MPWQTCTVNSKWHSSASMLDKSAAASSADRASASRISRPGNSRMFPTAAAKCVWDASHLLKMVLISPSPRQFALVVSEALGELGWQGPKVAPRQRAARSQTQVEPSGGHRLELRSEPGSVARRVRRGTPREAEEGKWSIARLAAAGPGSGTPLVRHTQQAHCHRQPVLAEAPGFRVERDLKPPSALERESGQKLPPPIQW